jgi:hypothetical protein
LSDLTTTLADKDQQLVGLVENFDRFTATLRTREAQLGKVMDQFASTTRLLAQERERVATLVRSLADLSRDGLDLVAEHAPALSTDIKTATAVLETVNANFDELRRLLTATPMLVAGPGLDGTQGLLRAYDPAFHHIDLRNATTPTLNLLLQAIGIVPPGTVPTCIPIDVDCVPEPNPFPVGASGGKGSGRAPASPPGLAGPSGTSAPAPIATPVDTIVGLLGSPGAGDTAAGDGSVASAVPSSSSGSSPSGLLGWLRHAARALAGAVG